MVKARIELSVIVAAALICQFLFWRDGEIALHWRIIGSALTGIPGLTALVVLIFSFFRVYDVPGVGLCYDPENFFWKTMKEWYGEKWRGRMSLCKTFWMTAGVITLAVFLSGMTCLLGYWLGYNIYVSIIDGQITAELLGAIIAVGVLAVSITGLLAIGHGFVLFYRHLILRLIPKIYHERLRQILSFIGNLLRIILLGVIAVGALALPLIAIHDKCSLAAGSWATSLIIYGLGLAAVLVCVLAVYLAFKHSDRLATTWLGQLARTGKKHLCPDLIACPLAAAEAEEK